MGSRHAVTAQQASIKLDTDYTSLAMPGNRLVATLYPMTGDYTEIILEDIGNPPFNTEQLETWVNKWERVALGLNLDLWVRDTVFESASDYNDGVPE